MTSLRLRLHPRLKFLLTGEIMKLSDALSIIRIYEDSIERSKKTRVAPIDEHSSPKASKDALVNYARKCLDWIRFGMEVERVIQDDFPWNDYVKVSDATPVWMKVGGFEDLPLFHTQKHIKNELHPKSYDNSSYHGLSLAQLKALPEMIENPVAIIRTPVEKVNNQHGFICVLEATDNDGFPLIVPVKPYVFGRHEDKYCSGNLVLSVYGKEKFNGFFNRAMREGRVVYQDREKIEKLLGSNSPHQLRGSSRSSTDSVSQNNFHNKKDECSNRNYKNSSSGIIDMADNAKASCNDRENRDRKYHKRDRDRAEEKRWQKHKGNRGWERIDY